MSGDCTVHLKKHRKASGRLYKVQDLFHEPLRALVALVVADVAGPPSATVVPSATSNQPRRKLWI